MNHIHRLFVGISIAIGAYAVMAILATISQLADAADRLYYGSGSPIFWTLVVVFAALIAWPLLLLLRLPRMRLPPHDTSEPRYSQHRAWLRRHLSQHPQQQVQTLALRDDLTGALNLLDEQATQLVKDTAGGVFVSTALIQNGRLDGLVMLGMQIKLIWKLAALYRLRPTPRQLTYLYGNVAGTMLLSNQLDDLDFPELASPIVSSVAPSLATAVPGMQGIGQLLVNSLASGSSNAFLTLRLGLIAKAYCTPLVKPEQQQVRQQATKEAVVLLMTVTKEQGSRVAKGVWSGIQSGTTETLQGLVTGTMKMAKQATDSVCETVADVITSTADTATQTVKVTSEVTEKMANAAISAVKTGGQAVAQASTQTGQAVADTATRISKAAASTVGKAADKVTEGVQGATQAGKSALESASGLLRSTPKDKSKLPPEEQQGSLL